MNYQRPELRDALASEYVLGTLHGPARRRFQQLLKADPQLQAAVDFWQRQLLPMAAPLAVAEPPPRLWAGIAARVAPSGGAAPPRWFERWFGLRGLGSLVAGLFLGIAVTLSLPGHDGIVAAKAFTMGPQYFVGLDQMVWPEAGASAEDAKARLNRALDRLVPLL